MSYQSVSTGPEQDGGRACSALASCVSAHMFGVRRTEIFSPTRRRARVADARHAAMYFAHVVCGEGMEEVGHAFRRHRTTVRHACGRVEDRRDDPSFDWCLELLEQSFSGYLSTFMPAMSAGRPQ